MIGKRCKQKCHMISEAWIYPCSLTEKWWAAEIIVLLSGTLQRAQANGRAKQTFHCDLEILSHKFCFVQLEWFWDVFWECLVIRLGITHIQADTVSISFAYMSVDAYFCIWLSDYILRVAEIEKTMLSWMQIGPYDDDFVVPNLVGQGETMHKIYRHI